MLGSFFNLLAPGAFTVVPVFSPHHYMTYCTESCRVFGKPPLFSKGDAAEGFTLEFPIYHVENLLSIALPSLPMFQCGDVLLVGTINARIKFLFVEPGQFAVTPVHCDAFMRQSLVWNRDRVMSRPVAFGFPVHFDVKKCPPIQHCISRGFIIPDLLMQFLGVLMTTNPVTSDLDW